VAFALALLYYFGPDADQDWVWITPGAIFGTALWLVISLAFKIYVANFTDYEGSYGTVGAVIVVMLWFYLSGIAILAGAELNAEIEHASPHGKAPGQKNAQGKLMIGARAARAFRQQEAEKKTPPAAAPDPAPQPKPTADSEASVPRSAPVRKAGSPRTTVLGAATVAIVLLVLRRIGK
jgi:membrane protein